MYNVSTLDAFQQAESISIFRKCNLNNKNYDLVKIYITGKNAKT
jgi:hypothetical protein